MTTIVAGHLVTMDPERPVAEAMAVVAGRIAAVGSLAEVRAAYPEAAVERPDAGAVLPGLIDAHLHLARAALKFEHDAGGAEPDVPGFLEIMARDWHGEEWDVPRSPAERADALRRVQPLLHGLGITGVVDPAVTEPELRGYQESWRRGELTVRVTAMPYPGLGTPRAPTVEDAIGRLSGLGLHTGFGDDVLRIGGVKVYFDGEGLKSEALLDAPWPSTGSPGRQLLADEDFAEFARFCIEYGWSMGVHAVGGGAVAKVVDLLARAAGERSLRDGRFQIIHGYLDVAPATIARAAELGLVASAQPSITWFNGARLAEELGARTDTINPLRSWLDAGARVALGSDGPFFPFDPWQLMWTAVTRRVDRRDDPLGPTEAITVAEALAGYTRSAADAAFAGADRGVLRAGRLADWIAVDRDPTALPADDLRSVRVLRTEVGGRTVFRES
ncbi:amidohydrolase [Acrocarpospora catenulata]|uniref:amidohydrolase n=1 Tax=Acrocarpospora catenulata TaxID=2836182 RepID=UPI001BD99E9C|nr:amidohydrolase family protein [Acrocarpospora catenulata]